MRKVEAPLSLTLAQVHDVIQAVFGWSGSHRYRFSIGGAEFGIPCDDGQWTDAGEVTSATFTISAMIGST
jgi:hypothetical protein